MGSISTRQSSRLVPLYHSDERVHRTGIAETLNNVARGKLNNSGSFTLAASTTTTTVTDDRVGANSIIVTSARSATAAAAADTIWISAKNDGSFVITHDSTADVDRTFDYLVFG